MNPTGLPPIIVMVLFAQSLVFAGWIVVSLGILWGMVRRSRGGEAMFPGAATQMTAVRGYLRDPATRARRWLWLGLTVALLALAGASLAIVNTA